MNPVKKIQCPACGATSVFKLNEEEYKCNYCQTTFKIQDENAQVKKDLKSALHQLRKQTAESAMLNPVRAKKMGCVIAVAVMIFTIGVGTAIFLSVKKQVVSGFHSVLSGWNSPTINKYVAFTGSKGPVVWEVLEHSRTALDSAKHSLRIIDPISNKIIAEKKFGETSTWSDNFNWNKKLNHEFLVDYDTVYNGSEDGGLQAFNMYTGEKIKDNSFFEKKYWQLKDGIAKVDSRLYNNEYVFYTNNGDEYYYFPLKRSLLDKSAEGHTYRSDAFTKNFYLSEGKKCRLYLIAQKGNGNDRGTVSERDIKGFDSGNKYYRKMFKTVDKAGEKIYPCAQRLISNGSFVVLAYLSDFSKQAVPVIEKIDVSGKSIWQNRDTSFKVFVENFSSDNLYLKYNYSASTLVLYNSAGIHRTIGIDLQSGKTVFVHSQGYQIED